MQGLEAMKRDETAGLCLAAQGERLVALSLRAVSSTWPVKLVPLLAGLLYTLLHHPRFSSAVSSWFQSCMQNDDSLGKSVPSDISLTYAISQSGKTCLTGLALLGKEKPVFEGNGLSSLFL